MHATLNPPRSRSLHESCVGSGRVDRAAGVIRGAKVLGATSKNGRRYTTQAMRDALPMYEGVGVNVDHDRRPGAERSLADRIGVLRNARLRDGAIVADLVLHKSHPMCEQILDMALNDPRGFGLSHDAVGECVESRGGETVVNRITRVRAVDLVGCPATVAGLFESVGRGLFEEDMIPPHAVDDRSGLSDVEKVVLKIFRSQSLSRADKLRLFADALAASAALAVDVPESCSDPFPRDCNLADRWFGPSPRRC